MGRYSNNKDGTLSLIAGKGNTDAIQAMLNKTSDNIAPKQETITASKLITAGEYFVNADGDLCQCDVQIASGGTIVVGSNCHVISAGGINDLSSRLPVNFLKKVNLLTSKTIVANQYFDTGIDLYSNCINLVSVHFINVLNGIWNPCFSAIVYPGTTCNGYLYFDIPTSVTSHAGAIDGTLAIKQSDIGLGNKFYLSLKIKDIGDADQNIQVAVVGIQL